MLREYLPQFIVALFAFAFAVTGSVYLAETDEGKTEMWGRWANLIQDKPEANTSANETVTVALPPPKLIVWSTALVWTLGGFYTAAGIAGFIHRTRPGE